MYGLSYLTDTSYLYPRKFLRRGLNVIKKKRIPSRGTNILYIQTLGGYGPPWNLVDSTLDPLEIPSNTLNFSLIIENN